MKYLITRKTIAVFIALCLLVGFSLTTAAQTITINHTFTENDEIYPFSQVDSIYGLNIAGHITLNSDTSLVRMILVDENYNEYLIYEAYPLITSSMDFNISNACDETCYLNGITPTSLILYVNHASIYLQSITYTTLFIENADSLSYQVKRQN